MNNDCSNIAIAYAQRNELAFFHTPPPRYTPQSPYLTVAANHAAQKTVAYTQQQLNMRRKAEILKYKSHQQNTKTKSLTQKEQWALLARGNSSQPINTDLPACPSNPYAPTWTTACDVPGPPMQLYYDPAVPLYNYLNASINNASYSGIPDENHVPYYLYSRNELLYTNPHADSYIFADVSNVPPSSVFYPNKSVQTRTSSLGNLVTTKYMDPGILTLSLVVPIGLWVAGSVGEGVLNTDICPDDETPAWMSDPSFSPHVDPSYGPLDYVNGCYQKLPGVFQPSDGFVMHILNVADMHQLSQTPVSLGVNLSGVPVTLKTPPTIRTSLISPSVAAPGKQTIQFADVSFAPYTLEPGQFYGIQYVGNLVIDNLQIDVQPEQVYDLTITMNYMYDYPLSTQFDYLQTGLFFNLSPQNQNAADGLTFASTPPPFVGGNMSTYSPDSVVAATTPTLTNFAFGSVGLNYVNIVGIVGNFDTYTLYRTDISGQNPGGPVLATHEFRQLTSDTFLDASLNPYTTYTYRIMPTFRGLNGSVFTVGTVVTQNVQIAATLDLSSVTTSSVSIVNITGNFTEYTVYRDVSNQDGTTSETTLSGLRASTFTDQGLTPGATYTYAIQGYITNTPSPRVTLGTVTTYYPRVTNAFYRLISNTSVVLDITGVYDYVNIVRNGFPSQVYRKQFPTTGDPILQFSDVNINTSTTYLPNGYILGQNYTYSVQPVLTDQQGRAVLGTTYTLPTIVIPTTALAVTIGPITITATSSSFILSNYQDYYYVSVAQIRNGVVGPAVNQPIGAVLYRDPGNAFSASSVYAYSIVPYNNLDIPGNTFTSINVCPTATVSIQIASITTSSVLFQFVDLGGNRNNFNSVTVVKNNVTLTTLPLGTTSFTDTLVNTNAFRDYVFSYTFIPYNILNTPGITYNSGKIAPLATVFFERYVDTSRNILSFTLQPTNTFSYVVVQPYIVKEGISSIYNSPTTLSLGDYLYQDIYNKNGNTNVFLPIYSYYFTVLPYNSIQQDNSLSLVTTYPVSPPAIVAFVNYNNGQTYSANDVYASILINYAYTTYYDTSDNTNSSNKYVSVAEVSGGVLDVYLPQRPGATSVTYTNLLSYVVYQFNLSPFNVLDQSGDLVVTPPFSPQSRLTPGVISNNDTDISMSFDASSAFASLTVTRITDGVYGASFETVVNVPYFVDPSDVFFAARAYSYYVASYNAIGLPGDSWTTPRVSPRATVAIGSVGIGVTEVSFSFLDVTAFYYVDVAYSVNAQPWLSVPNTPFYASAGPLYINLQTFTADSSYVFKLTPYNAVAVVNTPAIIQSKVVSPPATVTVSPLSITNYDLSLVFLNRTTYYSTQVARIDGGRLGPYVPFPHGTSFINIKPLGAPTNTLFYADVSYAFSILPYNALDVPNTSALLTTPPASPAAVVTTTPVFITNQDCSFVITNVPSRLFYYISVARLAGSKYVNTTTLRPGTTEYHDPSGIFYADTSYQYVITPYNVLDQSNVVTGQIVQTVSPVAVVGVDHVDISYSDASFAFTGLIQKPFYYVAVTRLVRGKPVDTVTLPPGSTYYVDPSAVFTADTSYAYQIVPYNAVKSANPAATVTTVPVSPVSVVITSPVSITTADASMTFLNPTGFYSLSIARYINGTLNLPYVALPLGTYLYDDPNPTPGATTKFVAANSYAYSVATFNAVKEPGFIARTVPVSPAATVAFNTFATITATTMTFLYQGTPGPDSYYYVGIARYIKGQFKDTAKQPPAYISYTDPSGLFYADISYQYVITPYNAVDVSNAAATVRSTIVSAPAVVAVSALSISGDDVSFSFTNLAARQFYDVSLGRLVQGRLLGGSYTHVPYGTQVYLDPSSVFTADLSYQYVITPYNVLGQANLVATIYTNTDSPQATIVFGQFNTVSYTQMRFTCLYGPTRYYLFSVRRLVNAAWLDIYNVKQPVAATVYTDPSATFTADSSYAYYVVPFNAVNFPNALSVFTTPAVSPVAVTTLGSFTAVSYNAITFSLQNPTSFYYTSIGRVAPGGTKYPAAAITAVLQPPHSMTYSDPSPPFFAYLSYTYTVTPFNGVDSSGATVQTATVSPPADASFYSYSSLQTNSLKVQFTYSTSYEYLQVAEVSGGTVGSFAAFRVPGGSGGDVSFVDTGLWPRYVYSYLAVPYNALDVSNGMRGTPNISPTAYVADTSFIAVSATTLSFAYNQATDLTFYDVSVARITNGVYGSYQSVSHGTKPRIYTDTAIFDASSVYQYSVMPYNGILVRGQETVTAAVSPPAQVTLSTPAVTTTAITLNYGYSPGAGVSFRNVTIDEWVNGNFSATVQVPVGVMTYTFSPRTANNVYQYYVKPVNGMSATGTPVQTAQLSPIPVVPTVTYGLTTPTYFVLNFANPSVCSYMAITRITDGTPAQQVQNSTANASSFTDYGMFVSSSQYSYKILPINALGAPGATYTTTPTNLVNTTVTFNAAAGYVVSLTSITFNFLSAVTFSYVSVTPIVNGTASTTPVKLPVGVTNYTDTANAPFNSDNSYCYLLTPYNTYGNPTLITAITTPTITSQATISTTSFLTVTNTVIGVSYSAGTSRYYYVTVTRYINGIKDPLGEVRQPIRATTYYDPSGPFYANTKYQYQFLPYNAIDSSNLASLTTTAQVSPPAAATFLGYTGKDVTSVTVNFGPVAAGYQYVQVATITDSTQGPYQKLSNGATSAFYGGLSPKTKYQFTVVPYNVLDSPNYSSQFTTPAISPYPYLTGVNVTVTGNTSIAINWGTPTSFYNVSVTSIINGVLNTFSSTLSANVSTYNDQSNYFYGDTSYAYVLTPYNVMGDKGVPIITAPVSAYATLIVTPVTITNRSSSFTMTNIHDFYTVAVTPYVNGSAVSSSATAVGPGVATYNDTRPLFTADNSYAYTLIPANRVGVANPAATVVTAPVSPDASAAQILGYVTTKNTTIGFTYATAGLCYYVAVTRIVNGILTSATTTQPPATNQYTDTGIFTADTSYAYQVVPYNAVYRVNPAATVAVYTSPVSPDASAPLFQGFTTTTNATMAFTYATVGLCYYVQVTRIVKGVVTAVTTVQPPGAVQYTDPSSGIFTADTSYAYQMVPYNAVYRINPAATATVRTPPASPPATVTIGNLSVSSNTISFPWLNTTSFYQVSVTRRINAVAVDTTTYTGAGSGTYTDPSNVFTADSSYAYVLTPYNAVGGFGTPYTTIPVSPAATITLGVVSVSATDISFSVVNPTSFYTWSVDKYVRGSLNVGGTVMMPPRSLVYVDPNTVFTADTSYAYLVKPYNAVGVVGTPAITVPVSPPASVQIGPVSTSMMDVSFGFVNPTSFYQVAVARMMNGAIYDSNYTLLPPGTTVYVDPSDAFIGNVAYSYSLIPYNAVGVAGPTVITPTFQVGINSAVSSQFYNVIDTTELTMYMPFDFITDTVLPSYIPTLSSVIDTTGLTMYYGFDV
jgi:hypothetical protein